MSLWGELVNASPATVLVTELAAARRRGEPFEQAWPGALAAAVAAAPDCWERSEWTEVLGAMVDTWRSAWQRLPATRHELALVALAAWREPGEPLPERPCAHCGAEMPADRHPLARYCDDRCSSAERARRYRERVAA